MHTFHPENIELKKYSFLVTGGAGFIGSHIVEYLLNHGAGKVKVLDDLSTGFIENIEAFENYPNFEFIKGDITDYTTCLIATDKIDYVLHQAALGSVPRSIDNPVATNLANVSGFLNVITAAKENKIKRFVYASSSSVYGDSLELPKTEDQIGKPLSPYAVSKLTNEIYADVFYKVYGFEVIGLRYFNIFGPRQSPQGPYAAVIPLFVDYLANGNSPFINGDGEQTRDFTYVENAVQANIKALFTSNKNALNKVYNIAVGDRISINELFNTIKDLLDSKINPTYRSKRDGDIHDSLADISLAHQMIEYNPKVKLKDGLKITVEWFKKYHLTKEHVGIASK